MTENEIIHLDTESLSQVVYRFVNKSGPWIKIIGELVPYNGKYSIQIILQENALTDAYLFICKDNGLGNNNYNYIQITQDSDCCLLPVSRLITLSFSANQLKLVFEDHQGLTLLFNNIPTDKKDRSFEIFVSQFRICASVSKNSIEDERLRSLNSNFLQRNAIPASIMPNTVFYDAFSIPTCVSPVVFDHDGAGETWVKRNMDMNASFFTEPVEITVCCLTWNVGGGGNPVDDSSVVKDLNELAKGNYDLYFLAFQEIDMSVGAVLTGSSPMAEEWTKCIRKAFKMDHRRAEDKPPKTEKNQQETQKQPLEQNQAQSLPQNPYQPIPQNPYQTVPQNPFNTMSQNQFQNQSQNQFQNQSQNQFSSQGKFDRPDWNQCQKQNPFNNMNQNPNMNNNNMNNNNIGLTSQTSNLISFDNFTTPAYPQLPVVDDLIDLTSNTEVQQKPPESTFEFDLELFSNQPAQPATQAQNLSLNTNTNSNLISCSNNSIQNSQPFSNYNSASNFNQGQNPNYQQYPNYNSNQFFYPDLNQQPFNSNSNLNPQQYSGFDSSQQIFLNPAQNQPQQQTYAQSSQQLYTNPAQAQSQPQVYAQTAESYTNFPNQAQPHQNFAQTAQPPVSQSYTNLQNSPQVQPPHNSTSSHANQVPKPQKTHQKQKSSSYSYKVVSPTSLGGVYTCVLIREDFPLSISFETPKKVRLGMHGMTANKSAIVYPAKIGEYARINFIGCHLSAGKGNVESRLSAMRDLLHTNMTVLSRSSSNNAGTNSTGMTAYDKFHSGIEKVDYIVLIGDLNYRINLSYEECLRKINDNDLEALIENDQLNQARKSDPEIALFEEGPISFLPTYKFDKHCDVYDTSPKQRVPSYTDRILIVTNKNKKDEDDDDDAYSKSSAVNDANEDVKEKFIFETDIIHDLFPNARGLQGAKHFSSDLIPNSFPSKPNIAFYLRGTNQFSDHRPVQGILVFKVPKSIKAKLDDFEEVQLKKMDEMSALAMPQIDPKSMQINVQLNRKATFSFRNVSTAWMKWHAFVEKKDEADVNREVAISPEKGVLFPEQVCEIEIRGLKKTKNMARTVIIESIDGAPLSFIEVTVS